MLTHTYPELPIGNSNPKVEAPAVVFNSKEKVSYSGDSHSDVSSHSCVFKHYDDKWAMNIFTLDAIEGASHDKIIHFNPNMANQFPKDVRNRVSGVNLYQHLHRHGQLQVNNTSSFNICRCHITRRGKKLEVTWGDGSTHFLFSRKADILAIELAVQGFDIVSLPAIYNFSMLQQWIRHTVACCIPCTSSTYFPIFSCIEQLAQRILTACDNVPDTHSKERDNIVKACRKYIQTHHTYQKYLEIKVNKKSLLTFESDLQILLEVVNDTLMELLTIDSDRHEWVQKQFLKNCRIPYTSEEALLKVLDQVLDDAIMHPSQPIIKYHSLDDITDWESYCRYCREYNIILYPYTVKKVHMEEHPLLFHLINRLIIENALALREEGKAWYDWQKLQDRYAMESDFLEKRSEEILIGVNSECDLIGIPHWDSPFDIDFQELRNRYDALPAKTKQKLKEIPDLKNKQIHQYINFAEFAIESARLGYFRIPAPIPAKQPRIKKFLLKKIDELTKDCPNHKALYIRRLYLLTPLITLLDIL